MNLKNTLAFLFLFFISCNVFGQFKFVSKSNEFSLQKQGLVYDQMIAPNNTYLLEIDIELNVSKTKFLKQDYYLHKFNSEYDFEKTKKLELEFDQKDKKEYKILHSTYFNNKILIFTDYWIKKEKKSKIEMRVYDAESLELISEEVLLDNKYNIVVVGRARHSEVVLSPDGSKLLVHHYCKIKKRTLNLGYCVLDADLNKISVGEYIVEPGSFTNKKASVDNSGNSYFFRHDDVGIKKDFNSKLLVMRTDKKEVDEVPLDFTGNLHSTMLPIILDNNIYFFGGFTNKRTYQMTGIAICKYNSSEHKVVTNMLEFSDDQNDMFRVVLPKHNTFVDVHSKVNGNFMIVGEERKNEKSYDKVRNPDGTYTSTATSSSEKKPTKFSKEIILFEINLDGIVCADKINMKSNKLRKGAAKNYFLHQSNDDFYVVYEKASEKKKTKDLMLSKVNCKDDISHTKFSLKKEGATHLRRLYNLSDTEFLYLNIVDSKVTFMRYELEKF